MRGTVIPESREVMRMLILVKRYRRNGPFEKGDPILERFSTGDARSMAMTLTERMSPNQVQENWVHYLERNVVRGEVAELLSALKLSPAERQMALDVITGAVMRKRDDIAELTGNGGRNLREIASEELSRHFEWQSATI